MKRNTVAKQLIRGILEQSHTAMSQDMLEKKVSGEADRVTIYRVLNGFCEDGVVHRIMSDEGKTYYALCSGCSGQKHNHEHAHFKCLNCENVECLPGKINPKLPEGYEALNANYWLSGLCKNCR